MYFRHTEDRSRVMQERLETARLNICYPHPYCLKSAIYWSVSTQSNYITNSVCSKLYHRSARKKELPIPVDSQSEKNKDTLPAS